MKEVQQRLTLVYAGCQDTRPQSLLQWPGWETV